MPAGRRDGRARQRRSPSLARFPFIVAVASLGGLLFGYDTGVISGALLFLTDAFRLSPTLQGVVTSAVLVGAVAGAAAGGAATDRYGRRRVIIAMAALFTAGSLASAAATALWQLIAARLVLGVAIGIASMLTPLYLSEIAPAPRRGGVVSLNQVCVTSGILLSYLVDFAFADVAGTWRWMLGLGAVPGVALGLGMALLPESPRWLAAQGRWDEARGVLARLRGEAVQNLVDREVEALRCDIRTERQAVSLRALFTAARARRPLVVGIGLAVFQQVTGINTVIYYAPVILRDAGFASNAAAVLATAGIGAVNVAATVAALLLMDRAGRRPLLLAGMAGMAACLVTLAGSLAVTRASGQDFGTVTALALAAYVAAFAVGLGPVFWLLIAEIFPLAFRGRGMSVASVANWGANLVVALVFLDLMRLIGAGGTFLLFAALTVAAVAFTWRMVPETKGRSLEEIEREMNGAAGVPGFADPG